MTMKLCWIQRHCARALPARRFFPRRLARLFPHRVPQEPHIRSGMFESSIGSGVPSFTSDAAAAFGRGTVSGRVLVTRRFTPAGSWSLMMSMCPSCSSGSCLIVISRLYVVNCARNTEERVSAPATAHLCRRIDGCQTWKASKCLWYLNGDFRRENLLTWVGNLTKDALTPICRVYCMTKPAAFSAICRSKALMTSETLAVLIACCDKHRREPAYCPLDASSAAAPSSRLGRHPTAAARRPANPPQPPCPAAAPALRAACVVWSCVRTARPPRPAHQQRPAPAAHERRQELP